MAYTDEHGTRMMSLTRFFLLLNCAAAGLAAAGSTPAGTPDDPGFLVHSQEFNLRVFPEKGSCEATVAWDVEVRGSAPRAQLTAYLADVAEVTGASSPAGPLAWKRVPSLVPFFSSVIVSFPAPRPPGHRETVTFAYTLSPSAAVTGLAAMNMSAAPDKMYFFECWYPTITPFIDENTFVRAGQKPPFTLTASVPAGFAFITAGELVSDATGGERAVFTYRCARPAPFLIPFLAGKFARTRIDGGPVPLDLFVMEDARAEELSEFTRFIAQGAALQARLLARPPPARLAVALCEAGGLARGFPGLIIVPPGFPRYRHDPAVASTTCHELAHTYFGNLVTAHGPGGNEFLSEGLATYIGIKTAAAAGATAEAEDALFAQSLAKLMRSDTPDSPIVQVRPMQNVLSGEVYSKGALVFNELARLIGEKRLWRLLGSYLARHAGGFATLDEFRRLVREEAWPQLACFHGHRALLDRFFAQYLDSTALPWVQIADSGARTPGKCECTVRNRGDGFGLAPIGIRAGGATEEHSLLIAPGETRTLSIARPGSEQIACTVDPHGTFLHGVRRASMLARAADLRRKGLTAEARAAYEELLARIPEDGEAWYGLGRLEEQAGQPAHGAECHAKAAALGGEEWLPTWGWLREAECRIALGDKARARALLERVLAEGNDTFDAKREAAAALKRIEE